MIYYDHNIERGYVPNLLIFIKTIVPHVILFHFRKITISKKETLSYLSLFFIANCRLGKKHAIRILAFLDTSKDNFVTVDTN